MSSSSRPSTHVCRTLDIRGRTIKDCLFQGDEEVKHLPRLDWIGAVDLNPRIHYGLIGSDNKVIARESYRGSLRDEGRNILCVETEAAGLMERFECLVIRGISNYADRYKDDTWKKWAACCAAAYAKELLTVIATSKVLEMPSSAQCSYQPHQLYEY